MFVPEVDQAYRVFIAGDYVWESLNVVWEQGFEVGSVAVESGVVNFLGLWGLSIMV